MIKLISWFKNLVQDAHFFKARELIFELIKILPYSSWWQLRNCVAIEVTSGDIKLLQLSQYRDGYRVDFFARLPLPTLLCIEKDFQNSEQLSLALARLIKRTHLKANHVITAFPYLDAITKKVTVQATENTLLLEQSILELAEKNLIKELEQLNLDYVLLNKKNNLQDKQDVLLVAVKTKILERAIGFIEAVGLKVKVVDLDAYALGRGLQLLKMQIPKEFFLGCVAVLELNDWAITLTVFSNQELIFVNKEQVGDKFQTHYSWSYQKEDSVEYLKDFFELLIGD